MRPETIAELQSWSRLDRAGSSCSGAGCGIFPLRFRCTRQHRSAATQDSELPEGELRRTTRLWLTDPAQFPCKVRADRSAFGGFGNFPCPPTEFPASAY